MFSCFTVYTEKENEIPGVFQEILTWKLLGPELRTSFLLLILQGKGNKCQNNSIATAFYQKIPGVGRKKRFCKKLKYFTGPRKY